MSKTLEKEEKRLRKETAKMYSDAQEDIEAQLDDLLKQGNAEAAELERKHKAGEMTDSEFRTAVMGLLTRLGYQKKARAMAEPLYDANVKASDAINEEIPKMVADGINAEAWEAETEFEEDLELYPMTEEEVAEWMEEYPELFPEKTVDKGKDTAWNAKNLVSIAFLLIAAGIAYSELSGKIAERVTDRNRVSMWERIYDTLSGAQETGRDAMRDVEKERGLEPRKEWVATLDFKTRDAHRKLDGQRVPQDEPFVVDGDEIWFPRDPTAKAYLRCNCRCGSRTIRSRYDIPKYRRENLRTPTNNNRNGWEKRIVQNTTYQEWYEQKRQELGDVEIQRQVREMRREQQRKYYQKKKRQQNAS